MSATLESMLSDENLALLKLGFDNAVAYKMALNSLAGPVPGAAPWVTSAGSYFFKNEEHMSPQRRELCIISMTTAMRMPDQLAIHVYWGLMVGLSVEQIGNALFLAGDYGGIACFQTALKATSATLVSLQRQATAASASVDAALTSLNAADDAMREATRQSMCKELLPVQIVVPALAGAVSRTFAGI